DMAITPARPAEPVWGSRRPPPCRQRKDQAQRLRTPWLSFRGTAVIHRAPLPRQVARSHEEFIDRAGRLTAFADRPDDKALAAAHVAAGEDVPEAGPVVVGVGGD